MKCEHITECTDCKKIICSYCVEDCSGCGIEGCKECYNAHLSDCGECGTKLCQTEKVGNLCPVCDMKNESPTS